MQAAKSGMTEVCRLYLKHGALVDAFTVVGVFNCLFLAEIVRILVQFTGSSRLKRGIELVM